MEKLCLCLYFSCTKLHHYLVTAECTIVSKADVIKHMLSMPILNGRVGKWIMALSEFDLRYESAKAVKGQIMADSVIHHRGSNIRYVELMPWTLFFDGSSCRQGGGIRMIIISPEGRVLNLLIPSSQCLLETKLNMKPSLKDFNFFKK